MTDGEHDISWALKLLEHDKTYDYSFLRKYYYELYLGMASTTIPIFTNVLYRRPIWTGIQMHFMYAIAGVGIGHIIARYIRSQAAYRDAQMRDYIMHHPEDFPPPERKKYADVFLPWTPTR